MMEDPMEDAAAASISELPTELVIVILRATQSAVAVVRCSAVCHKLASATRSDWLWQELCEVTWPLLKTYRSCPAVHLRAPLAPASWRQLFRARVAGMSVAGPHGWCELLRWMDESTRLASQRGPGWVVELGIVLLRIERARARHGLPISPALEPHELPVVSREASDASWEASDESWCRAQTVPHELLADPRPDPDLGPDPDQVLGTDAAARAALRRRGHPRRRGRHRETAREHARSECGGERAGDAARPECGNPNLNPKPNLNPNPNRAGDAARPECGRDARLVA